MSRLKPWREVSRETLLDCRVFQVEKSVTQSPVDDREHDFFRVRNDDWVQIVPVTSNEELVMVRQFRHGSQSFVLEVPGGLVDPGEAPSQAAARECLEETGYQTGELLGIGAVNPNPAIHTSRLHSFYAPDVVPAGAVQETSTEQTEVVLIPVSDVEDLLRAGKIDHALVVATLWRFLADRR